MSLLDKLVFFATMGQTNPPFTQTDYVGGHHLTAPNSASAGDESVHLTESLAQRLQHVFVPTFDLVKPLTVAIKVRFTTLIDNTFSEHIVVSSCLAAVLDGPNWKISTGFTGSDFPHPTVLQTGVWYQLVFSWDGLGTARLWVDKADPVVVLAAAGFVPINQTYFVVGDFVPSAFNIHAALDGDVEDLYIWHRALTQDEVDELNDGAEYPFAVVDDCKAVECCDDPNVPYNASQPTSSGVENKATHCAPTPLVTVDPPSGSTVPFPTYVFLHVNRPDTVIYYTTDGTTPTTTSTIYTAPFQVTSVDQIIQAFAQVEGCDPGPIIAAQYVTVDPTSIFKFGYSCDTTDKMGRWGQFAPNGVADYHWTLRLKLAANYTITRMEVYQTNAIGVWTSGQAWATDEFIHPVELGGGPFHVFPLGVFDDGLNPNVAFAFTHQINVAYLTSFGAFTGAQTYLWTLIGQPAAPLEGFFKLIIFLADGTRMESIIDLTCGDPPPPCQGPLPPTLTPTCTGIDIVTTNNADGTSIIGKNFCILRAALAARPGGDSGPCGDGVFRDLVCGVIASNPQTFHDTDVSEGCTYCYKLSVDEGACGIQESRLVCAQKLYQPRVALSLDGDGECNTTVTVHWSSLHTTGNITVVREASGCDAGATIYNGPGNTSGSSVQTIACDTCFKITGSNACATVTAERCISVVPPSCNQGALAAIASISGFDALSYFDLAPCLSPPAPTGPCVTAQPQFGWNGQFVLSPGTCHYNLPPGNYIGVVFIGQQFWAQICSGGISFDAGLNKWLVEIRECTCEGGSLSGTETLWTGEKLCGTGPAGLYNRTGGCSTRASIVIV